MAAPVLVLRRDDVRIAELLSIGGEIALDVDEMRTITGVAPECIRFHEHEIRSAGGVPAGVRGCEGIWKKTVIGLRAVVGIMDDKLVSAVDPVRERLSLRLGE